MHLGICKKKIWYFRYHETHFCIRMKAIGQLEKNMQNHKHPNSNYY